MNNSTPQFSILIPTYNRASLLPLAIESVLRQTFEDFELIVSNGGSTDNTREVVTSFGDGRIKYLEAETRLSMADNYQRALDHSTGEFIIFFSDDDAFVPSMLERVQRVINDREAKMVVFNTAFYYHESFYDFYTTLAKNSLLFLPYSGEVRPVSSQHALEQMFARFELVRIPKDKKHFHPFIGNIVCHRSVIDEIIQKSPSLFPMVPVDIYPVAMMLGLVGEYYHLNEPLLAWSKWSKNATTSPNLRGEVLRQQLEQTLGGAVLEHVPLKFAFPYNCTQNSLLQARNDLLATDYLKTDWSLYFIINHEQLTQLGDFGLDTTAEFREFNVSLNAQAPDVQACVRAATSKFTSRVKGKIRRDFPWLKTILSSLLRESGSEKPIIVQGEKASFSDFLESAEYLDRNLGKFSKTPVENA